MSRDALVGDIHMCSFYFERLNKTQISKHNLTSRYRAFVEVMGKLIAKLPMNTDRNEINNLYAGCQSQLKELESEFADRFGTRSLMTDTGTQTED